MSTIFTDHQKRISRFSIGITPLDDAALKSVKETLIKPLIAAAPSLILIGETITG